MLKQIGQIFCVPFKGARRNTTRPRRVLMIGMNKYHRPGAVCFRVASMCMAPKYTAHMLPLSRGHDLYGDCVETTASLCQQLQATMEHGEVDWFPLKI